MRIFDQQLLRLKQGLSVTEDQEVAAVLGMTKAAIADRKKRGAFPVDKVKALALERPELKLDVTYILTGETPELRVALADRRNAKIFNEAMRRIDQVFSSVEAAEWHEDEEMQLLEDYRRCTPEDRGVIRQMASRLAGDAPKPKAKKK